MPFLSLLLERQQSVNLNSPDGFRCATLAISAHRHSGQLAGSAPESEHSLACGGTPGETHPMRALIGILVAAAVAGGIYFYSLKKMPTTDAGTATTQAISLTGVRMDLNSIAQAERTYIASNGHCASLDELASSGTVNLARTGRDGYTYEIRCGDGSEFGVIARHASASTDPGVRYPILAVDQNMQIGEIQ